ncbi:precorrin-6y C5,15-methyltransferase (decarboxylating) subunit CbiE [Afipia sp. GAS231]|uniref:precorrin-6y C5,15-methyltransferase (decarboxylating) subunit CbiE n=1 Tax=Afipia sp. GAS231 TaxID=1882747 RepID=UPI00087C2071|nr:precorrin-6y C5,15-methyltransferase (decarboxylating) subunit CbiE [Afipia sp. GAS231]SDP23474.1 precorrin-6Y C5,15-methyltransferase (decarboxylating) [Afipia sp. GAS231]
MSDSPSGSATNPWLSIIGIGEDGLTGLSQSSRDALAKAEIVFGGPRHLRLAEIDARGRPWPVPFSVEPVLARRGRRVAVLASGDPFWHGAGGSLAAHLAPDEWTAFPAPSTFSLAAARLGWRLEEIACLGLHAAPFETLLPHLAPARRAICLLRDGNASGDLAAWLTQQGFGASSLSVMESLGGRSERIRTTQAAGFDLADVAAPVAVAIVAAGAAGLPRTPGLPDEAFVHDGQITKRPMRALTLSALAPRPGELLWDIGAGSGSISVEWCLAGGRAFAIETRSDRAANIRTNAAAFGITNVLTVVEGTAPDVLATLPPPNAVFVGGGNQQSLFDALWAAIPAGTRLVANAVTLETEALLLAEQNKHGGELLRIELAQAAPLGGMRGWVPSRPLVQWSVVR